MGPMGCLRGAGNLPPPKFHQRTIQPVASRYTDSAIAVQTDETLVLNANGNFSFDQNNCITIECNEEFSPE
jgi:hypothetical protein